MNCSRCEASLSTDEGLDPRRGQSRAGGAFQQRSAPRASPGRQDTQPFASAYPIGLEVVVVDREDRRERLTLRQMRERGFPTSEQMKVTERITRLNDGFLLYEIKTEDPVILTRSWTGRFPLRLDPTCQWWEYGCHEGDRTIDYINASRAERAAQQGR